MKFLLELLDWVIRTKTQGEQFDNPKSSEKIKWYSVILEFIQNAKDSFCHQYARVSENWEKIWKKELMSL